MKAFLAWLASFRLRILFRTSFLLLILAVVAMAVTVLQEEKQRSYDNYQASFAKTQAQIVGRLHQPPPVHQTFELPIPSPGSRATAR